MASAWYVARGIWSAPAARADRLTMLRARLILLNPFREDPMADSVYKVIELVGTSTESWERAARAAVERAAKSLRELRVAEVVEQDLVVEDGKVKAYRTKVKVSFKYG